MTLTGGEKACLLLCSHLGDPARPVLTRGQLERLFRAGETGRCLTGDRELTAADLGALGFFPAEQRRILALLSQENRMESYVRRGLEKGIVPITRATQGYPKTIRQRLGPGCPGVLWAKGDLRNLEKPSVSLVGCRDIGDRELRAAWEKGAASAREGYALVSGNARGADRAGQDGCLAAGGRVISIVCDRLTDKEPGQGMLYLSLEDYDAPFSAARAHSRNDLIHAWGQVVYVAAYHDHGGTWSGMQKNRKRGWSPIRVFREGKWELWDNGQLTMENG